MAGTPVYTSRGADYYPDVRLRELEAEHARLLAELAALHQRRADDAALLLAAANAYGAAHESRIAERDRLHAIGYQGDTATGAAYSALLVAEYDAQDALHAAYRAHAARATGGGRGGE